MMLDDLLTIIVNGGEGTKGTDLFIGPFPAEAPVAAVSVVQYGGADPIHTAGSSLSEPALQRPRVQVVARNASASAAFAKAAAVRDLLRWKDGTVGSTAFLNIVQLGDLTDLGPDGAGAFRVAASYEVWV